MKSRLDIVASLGRSFAGLERLEPRYLLSSISDSNVNGNPDEPDTGIDCLSTASGPRPAAVSDFNGDGLSDLAIINKRRGLQIRLGSGDGMFAAPALVAAGKGFASVAAADLNNDDVPDLAVTNVKRRTVSIHLGLGDGRFAEPTTIPVRFRPVTVTPGDFNADSIADLSIGNQMAPTIVGIVLGQGGGVFPTNRLGIYVEHRAAVTVGNFNDDEFPDVVLLDQRDGRANVHLGRPGGKEWEVLSFSVGSDIRPTNLIAGDFDCDGWVDLLVTSKVSRKVGGLSLFVGERASTLGEPIHLPAPVGRKSITLGKIDANASIDIAWIGVEGSRVHIRLGTTEGGMTTPPGSPLKLGRNVVQVLLADADSDGNVDLIAITRRRQPIVLLGAGEGQFEAWRGMTV